MTTNWNTEYTFWQGDFLTQVNPISGTTYENIEGAGYWQWANAYLTNDNSFKISFTSMTNTVAGYPEISFFHTSYFNTIANAANIATFSAVNLYVSSSSTTTNYEYLFSTQSTETRSLFYKENLQTLINLGYNTPNIMTNTTLVFGTDFTLSAEWDTATTTLGLADSKQTYLLWLWLNTAYTISF